MVSGTRDNLFPKATVSSVFTRKKLPRLAESKSALRDHSTTLLDIQMRSYTLFFEFLSVVRSLWPLPS